MAPKAGEKWKIKRDARTMIHDQVITVGSVDPLNNKVWYTYDTPNLRRAVSRGLIKCA